METPKIKMPDIKMPNIKLPVNLPKILGMAVETNPTKETFPLGPKKVLKKTLKSSLLAIIILIVFGGIVIPIIASIGKDIKYIGLILSLLGMGIVVIAIVIFVAVYFYQKRYFAKYLYDFTPDAIVIRKGAVTQAEITIPYEHIQDVYIDQDMFDKVFGLYDMHFSSVTYSKLEPHIDGLTKEASEGMKAFILDAITKKKTGTSVIPPVPAAKPAETPAQTPAETPAQTPDTSKTQ